MTREPNDNSFLQANRNEESRITVRLLFPLGRSPKVVVFQGKFSFSIVNFTAGYSHQTVTLFIRNARVGFRPEVLD
jgi:hypothetical protein